MSADAQRAEIPNDLAAFWMPFTPNRAFKKRPRLIARAKDMHYYTPEGRADPRRHGGAVVLQRRPQPRPRSSRRSSARPPNSISRRPSSSRHPLAFQLASRIAALAPADLDHVFFTNSGSEACDTALKIALAYHNVRGHGSRQRLIGRERGYHGVGFGGISVGGMVQQPQVLRLAAGGSRPSAGDLQSRAPGLHQGRAGMGRPSRRRARGHRRPARRLDHRRGDRRADGGLDRRAAGAEGLSAEAARDLRQVRHPADLRRGHHRLRPPRLRLRRRALRRHPRHDHLRQGRHLRHGADGRRHRAQARSTTRS